MIELTQEDIREAHLVILGQSKIYTFDGSWLKRCSDNGARHPGVEAALIHILWPWDNEGGSIILCSKDAPNTISIQKRIKHIRKHTDPNIFEYDLETVRGHAREARNQLEDLRTSSRLPLHGEDSNPAGIAIGLYETAFVVLAKLLRSKTGFRKLQWEEEGLYPSLTGDIPEDREPFSLGDLYIDFKCNGDIPHETVLPLIKESERDNLCRSLKIELSNLGISSTELAALYPNAFEEMKAYERRQVKMVKELLELEDQLARSFLPRLFGRAAIESKDFDRYDGIALFVDLKLLERVRGIIASHYPDLVPDPGVMEARPAL